MISDEDHGDHKRPNSDPRQDTASTSDHAADAAGMSITLMEVFYTALRAKGEDEEAIGRETPSEAAA